MEVCQGWSNDVCRIDFVCEHVHDSKCEIRSFNSVPLDGNCYVFHHNKNVNWFEANYECEKNNGRLATFRNIKGNEGRIAELLEDGRDYWIGLYRYEWRWADSRKLVSFSKFHYSQPEHNGSCLVTRLRPPNVWLSLAECSIYEDMFTFVCISNTTQCANNPCRNGGTCIASINNYSCRCAPGFKGSHCQININECVTSPCQIWEKCADSINNYTCRCAAGFQSSQCDTNTNECGSTPCQNGATFSDNTNNYTCLCAPVVFTVSQCHTCASKKIEPLASDMMMITIVIVQTVVIVIISTILVVVCIRKRNITRKSNDAELATRYETRTTPTLDNHIYSAVTGSDRKDNTRADGSQPAGQEIMIYENVVVWLSHQEMIAMNTN